MCAEFYKYNFIVEKKGKIKLNAFLKFMGEGTNDIFTDFLEHKGI